MSNERSALVNEVAERMALTPEQRARQERYVLGDYTEPEALALLTPAERDFIRSGFCLTAKKWTEVE